MNLNLRKIVLGCLVAFSVWNITSLFAEENTHWLKEKVSFPDFSLPKIGDKKPNSVLPDNGKPTLVHIFASW